MTLAVANGAAAGWAHSLGQTRRAIRMIHMREAPMPSSSALGGSTKKSRLGLNFR